MSGHRIELNWRGTMVATLADLPPSAGGVVLVGINPAPRSVEAGHYYQGQLGKGLWRRLEAAGLLDRAGFQWEDDAFHAAGNGLTDIVKRPTPSANDLEPGELEAGAEALRENLERWKPGLVLFSFKETAQTLLGEISPGAGPLLVGLRTFLLTGPYAASALTSRNLAELRALLDGGAPGGGPPPEAMPLREPASRGGMQTQRVTNGDKESGKIRIPRESKRMLPKEKCTLTVILRGVPMEARYDPRIGPDMERSGVLRVGKVAMARIAVDQRLTLSCGMDGTVAID